MFKANNSKKPSDTQTVDDIEQAIKKLKGVDRVGSAGQVLTTVGGAAAGGVAAGSIAAAAGATTLFGSTSLAGALGTIFVTTTPVGWVAGCAVAGAAAAYGASKMIKSGGRNDRVREELIGKLTKRLDEIKVRNTEPRAMADLQHAMAEAIRRGCLTEDDATRIVNLVELGKLKIDLALSRISGLIESDIRDSKKFHTALTNSVKGLIGNKTPKY